jgi:WD40 repeat protein
LELTADVDCSAAFGPGATTYSFDSDGNQQIVHDPTGDRTTHVWDYENKSTLTLLPDGSRVTMAFNPDGIRVRKMT